MELTEASNDGAVSAVRLPGDVEGEFQVYVNGVLQQEDRDYEIDERSVNELRAHDFLVASSDALPSRTRSVPDRDQRSEHQSTQCVQASGGLTTSAYVQPATARSQASRSSARAASGPCRWSSAAGSVPRGSATTRVSSFCSWARAPARAAAS